MKTKTFKRLAVLGLVVLPMAGLVVSTQMLANTLLLGSPLFEAAGTAIYRPWVWLTLFVDYAEEFPDVFAKTRIGVTAGAIAAVFWVLILRRLKDANKVLTAHGSARWATDEELEESGLLTSKKRVDGVVIGASEDGRLLTHAGKEHVFCFAPTRSGKGVGLVVPTLLTWTHSALILDIKGENWQLTSGWRALFSHCLYFNPTDPRSVCYNPLLEIRKGPGEVRDVQNVVEILCDDGTGKHADFWTNSAKSLLTGLLLHVLYAEEDKSLAGVLAFLRSPDRSLEESFERMLNTRHLGDRTHPVVANSAKSLLNQAEKVRSGIVVTAEQFLILFEDPVVADVTRTSEFRLRDMQYADNPVSLYMVIPPADQLRLKPLLRLMLVQLGSVLTESLEAVEAHHKLLLLLDEFPVLGRLDWFEAALAYIAGYDMKAYLIAQDLNQIEKAYGANNAILGNTHVRIAYASNDDRTAKRISDLLGQATMAKRQESLSGKRSSFSFENRSRSDVEFGRPLLTPGEVTQLDTSKSIVMLAGQAPILANKVRYYEDAFFKQRCPGRNPDGTIPNAEEARRAGWNPNLSPPKLNAEGPYADLPAFTPNAWADVPTPPISSPAEHPTQTAVEALPSLQMASEIESVVELADLSAAEVDRRAATPASWANADVVQPSIEDVTGPMQFDVSEDSRPQVVSVDIIDPLAGDFPSFTTPTPNPDVTPDSDADGDVFDVF